MKKHVMVVKYILYDLLHSLKHSGRLKFQLTLTLCIGMFFPLLCFGCFYASMLQFSTLPLVEEEPGSNNYVARRIPTPSGIA